MTTLAIENVQEDLNAVNNQITTLVDELNKINSAREQLVQQIQNLNGVAMYLRGKLPSETEEAEEDISPERSIEYPDS